MRFALVPIILAGVLITDAAAWSSSRLLPSPRRCACARAPAVLAGVPRGDGRRQSRVGQVVRTELATLIKQGHVRGTQRCPPGLEQMISIVDVDMSPDLRNARIKVSVIGDRKEKVSAVRWLKSNVRGLRHEMAQRNRGMKRVPMLTFDHVDVGAATDMMVTLDQLRREREAAETRRGERAADEEGGIDFAASDEEAWLTDEDAEDAEDDDSWLDDDDDDDDDIDDDDELEAAWERETRGGVSSR